MEALLGPEQWPQGSACLVLSERAAGSCGRDVGSWGCRGQTQEPPRLREHICSCLPDILTHS